MALDRANEIIKNYEQSQKNKMETEQATTSSKDEEKPTNPKKERNMYKRARQICKVLSAEKDPE